MVSEALEIFQAGPIEPRVALDATVGAGGHASALLDRFGTIERLIGIDRDPEAIARSREVLRRFGDRVSIYESRHSQLGATLDEARVDSIDMAIFDLGVSSHQMDDSARGFSFRSTESLDMRLDRNSQGVSARDIVNGADRAELIEILRSYGDEPRAARIADAIIAARRIEPIETGARLASVINRALKGSRSSGRWSRSNLATRAFMGIRIAVNDELNETRAGLESAIARLSVGARIVTLTFHRIEDRLVKEIYKTSAARVDFGGVEILTKKPLAPSAKELAQNRRSRSAKLRAAQKVGSDR